MGDIEIKLNFGAAQIDQAEVVFGLDGEPEQRRIWFGEVVDGLDGREALPLLARGVILRFREKRKSDATLKLRAPDGAIDTAAWKARTRALGKLEGDWAGDRRLISASLTSNLDVGAVQALRTGHPSVAELLSDTQRALATELMVPFDRAVLLGPVAALRWEAADGIEAEHWDAGDDDLRFLEISIVAENDPVGAMNRLVQRAKDGGLTIDGANQEPKTTRVLRALARRHQ